MTEKINIIKMNGTNIQAELICFLENTLTKRQFVFYTLNEIMGAQPNSTVKVYVSKISQNDPNLDNPISDAEWSELKGIMGEVLKGIENPNLKYLKVEPSIGLSCVSDKAIAMPTSYEYVSKHKSVYFNAILNPVVEEPLVEEVVEEVPVENILPTDYVENDGVVIEPEVVISEPSVLSEQDVINEPEAEFEQVSVVSEPSLRSIQEPVVETAVQEDVVAPETTDVKESFTSENEVIIPNNYVNMEYININEIVEKYDAMFDNLNKLKEQELEAAKRYNATLELSAMHNEQHASYVASEQEKEVTSATTINEPSPIEPVSIEVPNSVNLETNWFDLPQGEN